MVKISLEEAFVFDMLAIMDVKIQKMPVENTIHLRQKLFHELCEQLGHDLVLQVTESEEYLDGSHEVSHRREGEAALGTDRNSDGEFIR